MARLVPETANKTHSSRYFPHVYDADPKFYLTFCGRPWCKSLVAVGEQEIHVSGLEDEPAGVKKLIGDLSGLDVKLKVTNFHAGPLHVRHRPVYWCWLTRIDKVEASLGQHTVTIDTDRTITQAENGLAEIAAFIAGRLAIPPESPDPLPPRPDEQEEAQAEGEVIAAVDE